MSIVLFNNYEEKKKRLREYMGKSLEVLRKNGLKTDVETLEKALVHLDTDTFKTLIIGEFKRGKSTFINALFGQKVLPAYAIPCTAVINEVKWGEKKRAVLHFVKPFPEKLSFKLAPDVQKHVDKYRAQGEIPPIEIPPERVKEFVVIPDPGKDQAESIFESPYEKVELFWPLELCHNSVEIIDSPGLNEHKSRTTVTANYLMQADAVVFVMTCAALASASEMEVIDNSLRRNGYEDIFFICNRFDELRDEDERESVISYAHKKLDEKTSLPNGIQFVSAADALDAKLENDPNKLEKSGFVQMEKDLLTFLVQNRGRLKIIKPARELIKSLKKFLLETLPAKEKMLQQNYDNLRLKYFDAQKPLQQAEATRTLTIERIESKRKDIRLKVAKTLSEFLRSRASQIPQWLKNLKPQNQLAFFSTEWTKDQLAKITAECAEFVGQKMQEEQLAWEEETFKPLMEQELKSLFSDISGDLESFYKDMFAAQNLISGDNSAAEKMGNVSPLERTLAAAGGFLVGGIGSSIVGGTLGMNEMIKTLLPNIAVGLVVILLGVVNPFVLIPALLATGSITAMFSMGKLGEKIKVKVGESIRDDILQKVAENADAAAEAVFDKTKDLQDEIAQGLNNEIQSFKDNCENSLETLQQGELETKTKTELLESDKKELETLLDKVNELAFEA